MRYSTKKDKIDLGLNEYISVAWRNIQCDYVKVAAKTVAKHTHLNQEINTEIVNNQYIKSGTGLTCGEGHITQKIISDIDWQILSTILKTKMI